ncbi:glycosyltransferase [Pontibaca methylaminivorans]|uniref:glycosyltransferase n=1 Tax=Pontibaca methylaminivorans TaxID=515897 RepID=UPI002FD93A46
MKIAYILNTYPQPSHSFIRRELHALERGGAEVRRLAMRRSTAPLVDPADRAEAKRTTHVLDLGATGLLREVLACALPAPRRFARALGLALRMGRASEVGRLRHLVYLAEASAVARICSREGIEHLHAHFGTNAAAVALLAHALGAPGYSFTVHGPEEFDAPRALSLGLKLDRADFAVAVSQFGRSQLARWAAHETWPRLQVVHCSIEPGRFSDPPDLPEGPLRLVNIGRFAEQKGQLLLIEAMARLRETHPDLHLSLVGDGELRPQIEALIARNGLDRNVTLCGWLDEAGVRRELAAAHGLVLPSFAEGLPMVVMEAMAMGRPVIATYIAGIPELLRTGEAGWLVPAGDVGALVGAVVAMVATPRARLARMGQAGRERVLERHDAEVEAARLADHFRAAIERRSGAPVLVDDLRRVREQAG